MNHFSLIPISELKSKFASFFLTVEFDAPDQEQWDDNAYCLLAEHDVNFKGHFYLDLYETHVKEWLQSAVGIQAPLDNIVIEGIFIDGDFTASGSIINEEGDYGAFLFVTGTVNCQSLLLGGSNVVVNGNVTAKEAVYATYNHGYFKCNGTVNSPILIIEDHNSDIKQHTTSLFYYNDNAHNSPIENACYKDESGEYVLSKQLAKHLDDPLLRTFEELHRDIAAGEEILKGQTAILKDTSYWNNKVKTNYRDLRRVPPLYKSRQLCTDTAIKNFHALPLIPEEFITDALCQQLVKNNGFSIKLIPDKYLNYDLCMLAAESGTLLKCIPARFYSEELIVTVFAHSRHEPDINDVPKTFISESLLVNYVKLGKGLWLDKACIENNISKSHMLQKVVDSGIKNLDTIFANHCSREIVEYAAQQYHKEPFLEEWNMYMDKYKSKLNRLGLV